MKRRTFLTRSAGIAAGALVNPSELLTADGEISFISTATETTIFHPGIDRDFTIMQITDSHISCDNESDREYDPYSTRMRNAFVSVKHFQTLQPAAPLEHYKALLEKARNDKAEFLLLTGDMINYPSQTAVEQVKSLADRTQIPYLYTAGNHDWHYEGMEGSSHSLRDTWIKKRLKPLYGGHHPMYSAQTLNGVRLVVIDNSTYQVSEEQLAFFRQQESGNLPVLLFVHIPLYMPGMSMSCGHPDWGYQSDRGFEIERRERWSEKGNDASTTEFVKAVMSSRNVAAIFCGHWHQSRQISWKNRQQFITGAAFSGQYRTIRMVKTS